MRRSTLLAAACAALALPTASAQAVVGGHDAAAGAYPSIAEVHLGKGFICTGTLIAPTWVLTAGHCGSVTGDAVATPVSWPAPLIDVYIGSNKAGQGEKAPVARAIVEPSYLATSGYDVTLLQLVAPSTKAPTKVAGASERSIWNPGVTETIVGWGATEEGGSLPSTLQEGRVPITTDAYCGNAYDNFDAATMVCAGFPQGGVDTCQGDSGGPMFGQNSLGQLRVVGATSFGSGCAQPGFPGVYARVADTALRTWIASQTGDGVGPAAAVATKQVVATRR
jgi:trypsin